MTTFLTHIAHRNPAFLNPLRSSQFLRVTKLNDRYMSYDFSLTSAVESKPKALIEYRKRGVVDVIEKALSNYGDKVVLPVDSCEELIKAERTLLSRGSKLLQELVKAKAQLGEVVADDIKEMIGVYKVEGEEEAGAFAGKKEVSERIKMCKRGYKLMSKEERSDLKSRRFATQLSDVSLHALTLQASLTGSEGGERIPVPQQPNEGERVRVAKNEPRNRMKKRQHLLIHSLLPLRRI